jgi:hypothetical protein
MLAEESGVATQRHREVAEAMQRIADWNDTMSGCYVEAAGDVWGPIPESSPFPPRGWASPTIR